MHDDASKSVRGFVAHGVVFNAECGDQLIADCPFTGKHNKFYVNWRNRLWDSKTGGFGGNFSQFLERKAAEYHEAYRDSKELQARLSKDRKLPVSAFASWKIGWTGDRYSLTARDVKGHVVDLRFYKPGSKLMSTPGVSVGIFGHEQLADPKRVKEKVYLCEGEWDCIALNWLLRKLGVPGICLGVPGATTFKTDWIPTFSQRDVAVLYDNDSAGETGELRVYELLTGTVNSFQFVAWPESFPDGFDVRDWVVIGAMRKKKPRACWSFFNRTILTATLPRRLRKVLPDSEKEKKSEKGTVLIKKKPVQNCEKLFKEFSQWLHMKRIDPLAVLFGTVFANLIKGDPLWMFLVAPPGGMKSELLMSIAGSPSAYACSSLTPHALVSGASWQGGDDPSLIPKLNGKVLVIKDFTATLSMNPNARDEIFGQLRDCYDGKFEKRFGTGITRRYNSVFGIVAGVTPNIDAYSSLSAGLGERFLKYRLEGLSGTRDMVDEEARILKAIQNINHEVKMREVLQKVASEFLARKLEDKDLPVIPPELQKKIVRLSMVAARLRAVIDRERYNIGVLTSKASFEIGTRLGKQISKLMIGTAVFFGDRVVQARSYRLGAQVALGSVPDKVEEVVRTLYETTNAKGEAGQVVPVPTRTVVEKADRLTTSTVFRVLQDLAIVRIVRQVGGEGKYLWKLTDDIVRLIKESEAYDEVPRD